MDEEMRPLFFSPMLDSKPGTPACQSAALTNCASRAVQEKLLPPLYFSTAGPQLLVLCSEEFISRDESITVTESR